MSTQFVHRPTLVDAIKWDPDNPIELVRLTATGRGEARRRGILLIPPQFPMIREGDWIVVGTEGDPWVVDMEIFEKLYQPLTESTDERP